MFNSLHPDTTLSIETEQFLVVPTKITIQFLVFFEGDALSGLPICQPSNSNPASTNHSPVSERKVDRN